MLFEREPNDLDHKWYGTIRSSETFADFRQWCEEAFGRVQSVLDSDFPVQFGPQMPQRVSEMFYADALMQSGWKATGRVPGFDFAFELPSGGRLLVEVTTPAPQAAGRWTENRNGDVFSFSYDEAGIDAALLRLTHGFWEKSKIVQAKVDEGLVKEDDYVIVALSGLRISQETPVTLEIDGAVPDFVRAFLPIGPLTATVRFGEGVSDKWDWGHAYSGQIDKEGSGKVERTAFLGDRFPYVHAVAFTPLEPLTVRRAAECIGVLHNPSARWLADRPVIGIGPEYQVQIEEEQFHLVRLKSA